MAAIVKASSAIVKTSKLIPQKKGAANKAKISSKSISLVPKPLQTKTNKQPPGKIVKSPPGALVKTDDAIKINPTPISFRNKRDNPILYLVKEIENKVIKIDKLLKTSFLSKKNQSEKGRVIKEKKKFDKKEGEMEKKGNLPGMPKISGGIFGNFLDGLKRFFFFTLLGWLFFKLLPLIPKLYGIVNFIGKAMQFAFELFSGIVSGLTTFLAEGIKLTNTFTKGLGWLAGARTDKDFKKFEDTFNRVVDLTLLAAMLTADAGLDLFKRNKGGAPKGSVPKPGSGGRPRVTTSGGRSAGRFGRVREGIRNANPLKKGPNVTTSGGRNIKPGSGIREGLRNANPLRRGPKITSSGGNALRGFRVPKINAKGAVSGLKTFGIGLLLDYGVQAAGEKIGENVLNKQTEEFKKKSPKEQSEIIKRIESRLKKEKEWQSGAGGFVDKIISLGGLMGPSSSENLSENLQKRLDVYKEVRGGSYYKGGVVGGYASGGFVKPTKNKPVNLELLTKKPDKIKSKKTIPGKDVGGEQQIKKIFLDTSPEEVSVVKTISSFFNPLASIFGFFGGGTGQATQTTQQVKTKNTTKNLPNPFQLLLKTSKIFKEDPTGQGSSLDFIGKIRASAIDTILGSKQDKGLYRSIASSILYLANSIANNRMYGIQSSISSIMGFQTGGNIPNQSLLSGNKIAADQENTLRSLTGSIEFEMEQSSNKVLDSVRGEIRKTAGTGRRGTGRDEMLEDNRRRAGDGSPDSPGGGGSPDGGGGGTNITKIEMGDFSQEDIDALGRMVQAESGNQSKLGKAAVLSVILNRYRLAKSGDPGYMPSGKNKNNVTLRDILFASGQFSPIRDGRFDRTSSASGKKALADAISASGNDPQKFKQLLMRELKLDESKAETVVRATAFSNPETRGSKPFNTPEVAIGNHSFQESPYSKIGSFPGAIQARVERENAELSSEIQSLSKGFRTGLKTGPSERIGGSSAYHIDARFVTGLKLSDKIKMLDAMASAHASEGFVIEFSGTNVSGQRWNPNASQREKEEFAKKVLVSHHSARAGYEPFDYYIVKRSAKDRWDKSAEGANVMAPIIQGGTYEYQEGGGYGRFMILRDKDGKEIMKIGHGDTGLPSPKEIGRRFKMSELPEARQNGRREYDVIIPLDHHSGNVPSKSLWPNASLGASGRERQAQDPTAELIKAGLEKKGLRVKIMRPEDYGTEDAYNKDLIRYSQSGSVVSSLHYDAPTNVRGGGIGFLARLGSSPDQSDREYANKLAPILQQMAREAGGNQRYGGIDTAGNITMRMSGPATAALIELGALVEQEKIYGKQFWTNPEFIKHLNSIIDATASSVQKEQTGRNDPERKIGQNAVLNKKPVVWDGSKWINATTPEGKNIAKNSAQLEQQRYNEMTREQDRLIRARPWWDPHGLFGGAAAEKQRKEAEARKQAQERAAKARPGAKPKREWWDPRGWVGKEEGGSVIGKPQPNIPIPNKFASYETPGGKSYVAIQQIIVEKKGNPNKVDRATPSPSSSVLNSNRMDRMQSTSRK